LKQKLKKPDMLFSFNFTMEYREVYPHII